MNIKIGSMKKAIKYCVKAEHKQIGVIGTKSFIDKFVSKLKSFDYKYIPSSNQIISLNGVSIYVLVTSPLLATRLRGPHFNTLIIENYDYSPLEKDLMKMSLRLGKSPKLSVVISENTLKKYE